MSCYHPNAVLSVPTPHPVTGKNKSVFLGPYDRIDPKYINDERLSIVPCGHCIGCRLDRSRSWADRMLLEYDHTGKAIFVTLTYDNDHVCYCSNDDDVVGLTLNNYDIPAFNKRLREYFDKLRIRFYNAGEYGENTFRPHHHVIYFGIGLDDIPDLTVVGKTSATDIAAGYYYHSNIIRRLWRNGNISICDASYKTMAYVARYVLKKQYQDDSYIYYTRGACLPEFSTMSRRPGLSAFFVQDHPDCVDFSTISLYDGSEVKKIPVPKFLLEHGNVPTDRLEQLSKERREYAQSNMALKLSKTDLSYVEYLELEENKKLQAVSKLHRIFDKEL